MANSASAPRKLLLVTLALVLLAGAVRGIYRGKKTKRVEFVRSYVHFGVDSQPGFLCGGVLISWAHVLTAAHCEINAAQHIVYLGSSKRHNRSNAALILRIRWVHVHRMFRLLGVADLALVTLKNAGRKRLMSAGLVPMAVDWSGFHARTGRRMRTMGFGGVLASRRPPLARSLRVINVWKLDTLNTRTCLSRYFYNEYSSHAICVYADEKSTVCNGDSGSPLVASVNKGRGMRRLMVVGIVVASVANKAGWSCNPGAVILAMEMKPFKDWVTRRVGSFRRW